jgi:hypothetical protein
MPEHLTAAVQSVSASAQLADQQKAEELKAEKEALKAAKELERLTLAAKAEAAAKAAEEERVKLLAVAESGKNAAAEAFSTGKKGAALSDHIASMSVKPTGAGLLASIMNDPSRNANPLVWFTKAEYGTALSALLKDQPTSLQVLALLEVESYCGAKKFPMYSPGGGKKDVNLIELIFQGLLSAEFVDAESFNAWVDDDKQATQFRTTALVKTSGFMNWLNDPEEPDSEEEEEDDEVDAPRATVP